MKKKGKTAEKLSRTMMAAAFTAVMVFAITPWAAAQSPVVTAASMGSEEINVTFSTAMDAASVADALSVRVMIPGIGYGSVAGVVGLDDSGTTLTFTPTSHLSADLDYTLMIEGARDTAGNLMEAYERSLSVIVIDDDEDNLPVLVPRDKPPGDKVVNNALTFDQLNNIVGANEEGLIIDLGDESLMGNIYLSQYPFEAGMSGYDYSFFTETKYSGFLYEGRGVIPIVEFYGHFSKFDANSWADGGISTATPTIEYRLDLFDMDKLDEEIETFHIGMYGSFVSFEWDGEGDFRKLPTILEGPFVTLISSDDPGSVTIVWETDELCSGEVRLGADTYSETGGKTKRHSVRISDLTPDTEYEYHVRSEESDSRAVASNTYNFRTAPEKGSGDVVFAFSSDSRRGAGGGGERDYMGVNHYMLKQLAADMHRREADFLIFGGDLAWVITSEKEDFILEMKSWKQGMAPFWRSAPVYTGMGNHELLFNNYGEGLDLLMDKWPYATESSEAVFASEMFNPTNGPQPSDPRRPTYDENVYSFQYGPVKVISFNNSYWSTVRDIENTKKYGGSPWAYIMDDQLEWIEETIADADDDPTVKFLFLFTHSPVFPSMSHSWDGMWWMGDNNPRAYVKNKETGEVEPEPLGIIEVRNRLWEAIAGSAKSVAVFTGDEHAYHRTLIDSTTTVGLYPDDDTDGDGVLDQYSPNPEFVNPVWHITSGGGGAPYAANVNNDSPWTPEIRTCEYGYMLIRTEGNKATVDFIGLPTGGVVDSVEVTK